MVGIVDYNAGNIKSVERALASLGAEYVLSKNPRDLENVDKLIFPGVGEAAYAMAQLRKTGFISERLGGGRKTACGHLSGKPNYF